MLKRLVDLAISLLGLVLVFPFIIIIAVLIKLSSPGPVFFRQVRIGKNFQPFHIYKFRTMTPNSPAIGPAITAKGDHRITPIGTILRKLKIDELPQLINVMKGEMSLVGPRPEVPLYVESFKRDYEFILKERPGITDLASIHYIDESSRLAESGDPEKFYLQSILPHKISLAKTYVQHQSMVLDLKILFATLKRLLFSLLIPFSKRVKENKERPSKKPSSKLGQM